MLRGGASWVPVVAGGGGPASPLMMTTIFVLVTFMVALGESRKLVARAGRGRGRRRGAIGRRWWALTGITFTGAGAATGRKTTIDAGVIKVAGRVSVLGDKAGVGAEEDVGAIGAGAEEE